MTETTGRNAEREPRLTNGTISAQAAAALSWDVIVIGAGPAGSMAARLLAGMNRSVLLIEAKKFPRNKVCGGCLNARTLNLLARRAGKLAGRGRGSSVLGYPTFPVQPIGETPASAGHFPQSVCVRSTHAVGRPGCRQSIALRSDGNRLAANRVFAPNRSGSS